MSSATIGILMFVLMIGMVLAGVPVIFSMFTTSIMGIVWIAGPSMLLSQLVNGPFTMSADFSFAIMPMFTMLGIIAEQTGIATGAYTSMRTIFSRRRGSLLYTTVAANAVFGACSGVGEAGSIIFSKIALPELEGRGYDRKLSLGCVAVSGGLACLIPPSVPICQTAILAGYSIGTSLMCGLGVGLLTIAVLFAVIKVISIVQPSKIPPVTEADRQISVKEKLASMKLLIPILVLFMIIIGGTFFGWFHATIAGAIGAVIITIYALVKRLPAKKIFGAAWESAVVYGGIFMMIVAGTLFSRMITISGLTDLLVQGATHARLSGLAMTFMVAFVYLLLGCVMDIFAVVIITVPVIFPILVQGFGVDPYMLIIMITLVSGLGALTPPIGIAAFTVSNVTRIPAKEIFQGLTPFFLAELLVVVLIILFPQLCTWLPNVLGLLS